ncbi:FUSC family protein [Pseudooceanicola sp. GBMRC 2024]|uniref:FUSC family protein n=1 Tax=Pseudooceanicola albus TaxID=2692189 RepID=A0A6L7G3B7_9RHOB|nr:FUSC family protein [Pseudooceanicola albus]MXN17926.1 FUSC family protein [Pseudooceanicola albus]
MIPGGVQLSHVVFSLRTFAAAMLAYWIALSCGLSNPYWAAGTVYIIANPLSGAVTSKAVYRLGGTVIGAAMIVLLVPALSAAPVLLSAAIALWCGLCLFVSLLDRSPRAYVFMLGGYTVSLTGFTLVTDPASSFAVSVSRVEEIAIGILCAALLGRLILPQRAGPILATRVKGWLDNAARLSRAVLDGESDSAAARAERHRLAADAVALRAVTAQVGHEGPSARRLGERMEALQHRMVMVLPLLSELGDLRAARGTAPEPPQLALVRDWLAAPESEALAGADALQARLNAPADPGTWNGLLDQRLLARLSDLVALWTDCRLLRADIASGEVHALRRRLSARYRRASDLHTDYGMALLSALALVIVMGLGCTFWIWSGWSYAAGAVQMASILCSVLATIDNAVPVMKKVLGLMLLALALAFAYQFAILPMLDGFLPVAAALGLVLIPCGVLLAVPATWLTGFQISVNLIYMLTLKDQLSTNFDAFANAGLASLGGLILAMLTMAAMRSIGAERGARRLLRAGWDAVIEAATGPRRADPERIAARMLDRLGLAVPRLAALPATSALHSSDILRDLRVGQEVLALRQARDALPEAARQAATAVLTALATQYRTRRSGTPADPAALLPPLDQALRLLHATPGAPARSGRDALVGLRGALCPGAAPPDLPAPDHRRTA